LNQSLKLFKFKCWIYKIYNRSSIWFGVASAKLLQYYPLHANLSLLGNRKLKVKNIDFFSLLKFCTVSVLKQQMSQVVGKDMSDVTRYWDTMELNNLVRELRPSSFREGKKAFDECVQTGTYQIKEPYLIEMLLFFSA